MSDTNESLKCQMFVREKSSKKIYEMKLLYD